MRTLFHIDTKDYDVKGTVAIRPSVRAIIICDGKIALVHSLKYDYYKFPGGGIEANESISHALMREVQEETGLEVIPSSIKEFGMVHRIQKGKKEDVFVQDNYYYFCNVQEKIGKQSLQGYELEERFSLEFVFPLDAIFANKNKKHGPKDKIMIERDSKVLEVLIQEKYI
ncbi:MAG: NUDIX domain-containing protein [Bacilli bacterium]|jgi:ADP-ribose pyrophosphatase YjhB (NUDIX family)|nr:NUDIX domain-containing protein [Bacilli bacterium]